MKTLIFPLLIAVGTALQIEGQETLPSKATLRTNPPKKEAQRPVLQQPKRLVVESPRITYGGVAVDIAKARKPATILDRTKASKSQPYPDNVYRDPATRKPKGFVLFAIRF